jgi:hypothetical protein
MFLFYYIITKINMQHKIARQKAELEHLNKKQEQEQEHEKQISLQLKFGYSEKNILTLKNIREIIKEIINGKNNADNYFNICFVGDITITEEDMCDVVFNNVKILSITSHYILSKSNQFNFYKYFPNITHMSIQHGISQTCLENYADRLEYLDIVNNKDITDLSNFKKIKYLCINYKMKYIGIQNLHELHHIQIEMSRYSKHGIKLNELIKFYPKLESLDISGSDIKNLYGYGFEQIKFLQCICCENLSDLSNMTNLIALSVYECDELNYNSIFNLQKIKSVITDNKFCENLFNASYEETTKTDYNRIDASHLVNLF